MLSDVNDMCNINYNSSLTLSTPTTSFLNTHSNLDATPETPLVRIFDVARRLFPYVSLDEALAQDVLRRAEESVNSQFTIQSAVEWADGFVFPSDVGMRDALDLDLLGDDLSALVRLRQSQIPHVRISKQRLVDLWDHSDPDFALLCSFAEEGVPVLTSPDFVPNPEPPSRFSPTYTIAHEAVNKMNFESFTGGLALILPASSLRSSRAKLHYSRLGHALKSGKAKGRPTSNYTYGKLPSRLNTKEVKDLSIAMCGNIDLPTVTDLARMVLEQVDRVVALGLSSKDLVLWKMDLKGAFTLLFFKPSDCGLLALPMTGNLVYIPIAGNFGLTLFPFFFNVISRSLRRRILQMIKGGCCIYSDDIQGCCLLSELQSELAIVRRCISDLLGSDAIAEDKTDVGRVVEWIGWSFDLDTMSISLAERNYYKTLYGFLSIRRGQQLRVKTLHTLSSWASRYVFICPEMTPFSGYLYSAFKGYLNEETLIELPDTAYLVVVLWRTFFMLLKLDPQEFTLPLESLRPVPDPTFLLEVDGCPEGIGCLIYTRCELGGWKAIFAFSWCKEYSLDNDSRYQNSMEFIACVMGVACLCWLGFDHESVAILGDNKASLAWIKAMAFRPGASTSAALCFVLLHRAYSLRVATTDYRIGEDNVLADPLSRGADPSSLGMGFTAANSFTRATAPAILLELSVLLDPSIELMEESELLDRWARYTDVIQRLQNLGPGVR